MGEYQYFEWQTIDRPLNDNEITEVSRLSSHMDLVTSTQAVVTYSWGDFKHDPEAVLLEYFDAFLYLANWGSRQVMFRFPKDAIDAEAVRPYLEGEQIQLTLKGKFYILDIRLDEEEGFGWVEGGGILAQLVPVREQIINGDYRALYLAWLKAATLSQIQGGGLYIDGGSLYLEEGSDEADEPTFNRDVESDLLEPPVPPGLGELSSSLQRFIEFFDVDPYLVEAAAQASPAMRTAIEETLLSALPRLSPQEVEDYLRRLLVNEPLLSTRLRKRLAELSGKGEATAQTARRTLGELSQIADRVERETRRREVEEAERSRIAELKRLAKEEESTWHSVANLLREQKARPYDEATQLLVKLRDLAVYQNNIAKFENRFAEIRERFGKSSALMRRFREAGIL